MKRWVKDNRIVTLRYNYRTRRWTVAMLIMEGDGFFKTKWYGMTRPVASKMAREFIAETW